MTTTDTEVTVTQADRIAAYGAYATCYEDMPNDAWMQALLDGKHDDDPQVQTLARHRTPTPTQAAGPVLLEALKRVLDRGYVSKHIGEEHGDHMMIVAAITQAEGPQA